MPDERSDSAELRRIDFAGAAWFGATMIAAAVPLAGLLAAGWRPSQLPPAGGAVWWVGMTLVVLGLAALAWAGCPVLGSSLDGTVRQKSVTIRLGLALFGVGGVAALVAILTG